MAQSMWTPDHHSHMRFLLKHDPDNDDAPVHRASFMKTWFVNVGVKESEKHAQSLDPNPTGQWMSGSLMENSGISGMFNTCSLTHL